MRYRFERPEPDPYPEAVRIDGCPGVAWVVLGYQTEPEPNAHWDDYDEQRTGKLVCRMVGDDAHHLFDPEDIQELNREDYCGVCGQIGCTHDGYERDDD